jgi:protein-S-isoprenylcysteine O-methyltransferase Ste14
MKTKPIQQWTKSLIARGGIIIFFIMAFEVAIMISPFAFFFYSVFNPVFHWLNEYSATRWLTHFFLPHMILPPTMPLRIIRVTGSILFVLGSLTFVICALQVYIGKIFQWGIANKGLYRAIRHPQYLALGILGIGMAILWPRFIVLVTLSIMIVLYYVLAKDEERRMLRQYGESYREYMNKKGMFLPLSFENLFSAYLGCIKSVMLRNTVAALTVFLLVIGTGFIFRYVTLNSLHFESKGNISLVSIMPEDTALCAKVLNDIAEYSNGGTIKFLRKDDDYLGYVMPVDYIMQGMIADTGVEHHLQKQQHTFVLITDWVLHPFRHLRQPPSAYMAKMHNVDPSLARRHHCPLSIDKADLKCDECPYRRIIIVEISHSSNMHIVGTGLLSLNATRTPVGYIDIDIETGEIVNIEKVGAETAWKDVPTPAI